jgi:hypothetical protein
MNEIILNLHIHTNFSDGSLPHKEVAKAAMRSSLDAIFITDHNVRPLGLDGYYAEGDKKVLVMVGEEVHNQDRQPQKSHLLVLGTNREMAQYGDDPQRLIDAVNQAGGISFLAHPYDPTLPSFHEDDISWEDWQVSGYQGIELWNGFSELKVRAHNKWQAVFLGLFPKMIAHQPPHQTLKIWDDLLNSGRKIVAVGGSDSHAGNYHIGPIHKIIFPYEFHFHAINTHVFLDPPLGGDAREDALAIQNALAQGHCFVANDMPAASRGFQFFARKGDQLIMMGEEIKFDAGIKLAIRLPFPCECRLLRNGTVLQSWNKQTEIELEPRSAGVYRIECYRNYLFKKRGWIFSNPIYLR